jgi:hypothetical protein
MKGKVFLVTGFVVVLVFGFAAFSCTAQNPTQNSAQESAQNPDDTQQFVGTWRQINSDSDDIQWVFNADGTGSYTGISSYGPLYTQDAVYVPDSGRIIIFRKKTQYVYANRPMEIGSSTNSYEYFFVDGGTTLVFLTSGSGYILEKTN